MSLNASHFEEKTCLYFQGPNSRRILLRLLDSSLWIYWILKCSSHVPSKRPKSITQWPSVKCQKTWRREVTPEWAQLSLDLAWPVMSTIAKKANEEAQKIRNETTVLSSIFGDLASGWQTEEVPRNPERICKPCLPASQTSSPKRPLALLLCFILWLWKNALRLNTDSVHR